METVPPSDFRETPVNARNQPNFRVITCGYKKHTQVSPTLSDFKRNPKLMEINPEPKWTSFLVFSVPIPKRHHSSAAIINPKKLHNTNRGSQSIQES
jgi:hypothetical protein